MDSLDLKQYRKILTLVISGAIVFALNSYGLGPDDLVGFGFSLGTIADPLVDFLLTIGIPAVFTLAQPNDEGESLLTYWRWVAAGIAVLVLLVVAVVLIAPLVP